MVRVLVAGHEIKVAGEPGLLQGVQRPCPSHTLMPVVDQERMVVLRETDEAEETSRPTLLSLPLSFPPIVATNKEIFLFTEVFVLMSLNNHENPWVFRTGSV